MRLHRSLGEMRQLFWSEWFWLPRNTTWTNVTLYNGDYRTIELLKVCICTATFLSVLRILLTHLVFIPLGVCFGLRTPTRNKVPCVPVLEDYFTKVRRPSKEIIKTLSEQTNLDVKTVEFWFHKRRNFSKKPLVMKFAESGCKLCFYCSMFVYGIYSLHDKPYLYDVKTALVGYPMFELPTEIFWYYAIELAYYFSELFWIFHGVRRSDFKVLLVHHMATIGLLIFSYLINHHRIGSLVLVVHDIADCWMEGAKLFKYIKKHTVSEVLFAVFLLIWIVTRLTYFPFWIIYNILEWHTTVYPTYVIIVSWLFILQAMHIYWFYLIIKIAVTIKTKGNVARDCRSDSDTSDEVLCKDGRAVGEKILPGHVANGGLYKDVSEVGDLQQLVHRGGVTIATDVNR